MEQPPDSTNVELKRYLVKMLTDLNYKTNDLGNLPVLTVLPAKPQLGKLYYFKNAIAPSITVEGVWVKKITGGWTLLG